MSENYTGPYPINEWDAAAGAVDGAGSVAVIDVPAAAPVPKKRKLRMSPAERDRRSKHIAKYQHLASAASAARSPEERSRVASIGAQAKAEQYSAMKAATGPETPHGYRLRRIELEGKRDWLLDKLIECAETETKMDALSELRAALTEIRAEIPILLDREERATKAAGQAAVAPRPAIGPAPASLPPPVPGSGGISPAAFPAISAADIPPAIAAD